MIFGDKIVKSTQLYISIDICICYWDHIIESVRNMWIEIMRFVMIQNVGISTPVLLVHLLVLFSELVFGSTLFIPPSNF